MPVSLEVVMSKAMLSLVLPDSLKDVERNDDTGLQILLMLYFSFTIRTLLHGFDHPLGQDSELPIRGPQDKRMIRQHQSLNTVLFDGGRHPQWLQNWSR